MLKIKDPYLQSIVVAGVCLLMAACLLVSGYLVFFLKFYPEFQSYADRNDRGEVSSVVMSGRDFQPSGLAPTEVLGDSQRVLAYVNNRAMLVSSQYLEVGDFPFVRFDVEGMHRDMQVKLIWRRLDMDEGTFHEADLHTSGDGVNWHNMAKYPEWRGTIVEIGIGGEGRSNDERFVLMRDEAFVLNQLELMPFSRLSVLKTVWDEWTYFEGWTHSSVNHYRGFPSGALLPPNLAILTVLLLASALAGLMWLWLQNTVMRRLAPNTSGWPHFHLGRTLVALLALSWVMQDGLRMTFRINQAIDTHELYAGKPYQDKVTDSRLRCDIMQDRLNRDCRVAAPLPHL